MKRGYIDIPNEVYTKDWNIFSLIFKDFRPIKIDFGLHKWNEWRIYGDSELFDKLIEGEVIPQYDVLFTTHIEADNYTYTYKFKKVTKEIINEPGS